jgi:hypothetical protein
MGKPMGNAPNAMSKRRRSGQYPCNKQCKNATCTYVAGKPSDLKRHLNTIKFNCDFCSKCYTQKGHLVNHIRAKHPEKAAAACTTACTAPLKNPSSLSDHEWAFVKNMVRRCILNDTTQNISPEERVTVEAMTNQKIHDLTHQIVNKIIKTPDEWILRAYGGLFQLSLDRIDNKDGYTCIHFPDITNAFANIRLSHLCGNTQKKNIRIEEVQKKVYATVTTDAVDNLYEYENRKTRNKKSMTLYSCVCGIFGRDKRARETWKSVDTMWRWARDHLKEIGGRCEISHILLQTNEHPSNWQVSIDAIDPAKGHVPGNLRFICLFLNCANFSTKKTYTDEHDGVSAWTRELFVKYFNIDTALIG